MKKICIVAVIAAIVAVSVSVLVKTGTPEADGTPPGNEGNGVAAERRASPIREAPSPEKRSGDEEKPESAEPSAAETGPADPAEVAVDAFDAETDRWMDAEGKDIPSMADVEAFAAKFREVPDEKKEECLQRALNLIPDGNVMLLLGILMDKSQNKDLVSLVYNDILNRSDEVKRPVLSAIYKDRSHPCWADTAWILDVTGAKPAD